MAKWTAAKRKKYLEEHPENFAGPDGSYPVEDGSDVEDAWNLAGHADSPDAVRSKIKSIAKRLGLTSSLPDTAKDDKEERSMPTHEALTRAMSTNHEPYTGTHTHSHDAQDSQGDDAMHEHEHSHDGDATHDHSHAERSASSIIQASDRHVMSLPLVRIDATKREVWGQATAEVPDSYGTIFGYYPEAWQSWRGNIREQHDAKKAVGKRFGLECDDLSRSINVGSRISRGAQDTWLKVEDNVLTGYSASIIPDPEYGFDTKKWPQKEYNGKMYPYLPRYTVAELSLVDNPACPGCNIQIVRADGFTTDIPDTTEETTSTEQAPLERAGARVSTDTKGKMHDSIGHTLKAAHSQMMNCGCEGCCAAMKILDPDNDGDIDLGGFMDTDNDADQLYGGSDGDMERKLSGMIERVLEAKLSLVYARLQGIAGTLARSHAAPTTPDAIETIMTSAITRAVEAVSAANESSLSEVRAELSAVKGTVDKIADTPMPGAPVMHAGSRPVDKRLATDPYEMPASRGATADAVAAMFQAGQLNSTEKQVDAVAAALAAQRRGR